MKEILNQFAFIEIKGHEWIMIRDAKVAMEQYAQSESQFQAFKADELEKQTTALADDLQKAQNALKDCRNAIEWALNNTTADHESVQSDFFNILMNARTAADRILNPELEENKPFDPKQELNF